MNEWYILNSRWPPSAILENIRNVFSSTSFATLGDKIDYHWVTFEMHHHHRYINVRKYSPLSAFHTMTDCDP